MINYYNYSKNIIYLFILILTTTFSHKKSLYSSYYDPISSKFLFSFSGKK